MQKFIPYGKHKIFNSDLKEVKKSLKSNLISNGEYIKKFENSFKKFTGCKYALTCSSGTAAIHLALEAAGVKKFDNIIIPSINFIAAANLSKKIGANIFLADVDKLTGQMKPSDLINCIKKNNLKKIKVFFVMHNGGNAQYLKEFNRIKKRYKTILIEDACHALGGKYYDKKKSKVGSCKYSDMTTFSFHPLKSITTGEGGMVTTSNKSYFEKIKLLRNHGILRKKSTNTKNHWSYDVVMPGYNYRMSDINCALGFSQLKKINNFINKRKKIALYYSKKLKNFSSILQVPFCQKQLNSAWHLYIVNINFKKLKISKDTFINKLYKKKIITQVHYIPTFRQSAYKKLNKSKLINTKKYFDNSLSLPIFYDLSKNNQNWVINFKKKIFKEFEK